MQWYYNHETIRDRAYNLNYDGAFSFAYSEVHVKGLDDSIRIKQFDSTPLSERNEPAHVCRDRMETRQDIQFLDGSIGAKHVSITPDCSVANNMPSNWKHVA